MKKLGVLTAAMAVLALSVPAMAGAASVTSSAGKLAPAGSVLTATGIDITFQSDKIAVATCAKLNFATKLTKNDGTTVEASSSSEKPPVAECIQKPSNPITITSVEITKLFAASTGSSLSFKLTVDFFSGGECTLTGTQVPFTYIPGDDRITFSFAHGITGNPTNCGNFYMEGNFTLEIGSTPVILD
jgi:hypothetical protein